MEAKIKLKSSELNTKLLKQIRKFSGKRETEITINIKKTTPALKAETKAQMRARINSAIKDVESKSGLISFTLDEFEQLSVLLSKTN